MHRGQLTVREVEIVGDAQPMRLHDMVWTIIEAADVLGHEVGYSLLRHYGKMMLCDAQHGIMGIEVRMA